jgi:hypothetical protein
MEYDNNHFIIASRAYSLQLVMLSLICIKHTTEWNGAF